MILVAADAFQNFLTNYGYLAVFLAAMIEGESIVLTASIFASQGKLQIYQVAVAAFMGTLIADQALYFIGRIFGPRVYTRFPTLKKRSRRITELLEKYTTTFIMSFRFVYGIRILSPLVIGAANIPPRKFMILNFISAIVWAVISCAAGYFLGELIFYYLEKVQGVFKYGIILLVSMVIIGFIHKISKKLSPVVD
ncbi:MAG: DedA family protein [Alphaproteobacteria bacterium]|nr:MAG: DedA family protein [Alphaproteobacteria bacterium]